MTMNAKLETKRCEPCEKGAKPLHGEALETLVSELGPGWKVMEGRRLEKDHSFKDFREALTFTNRVGELAEQEGHHPDIFLSRGRVKVQLSTHSIGGLSENDFILAAKVDALK